MSTTEESAIEGRCDERFARVRDVFAASVASGADLGGSVVVDIGGETLVDIWGGWADEAQTRPWVEDTITNVWSTTKTMTNLCALVLADRGLLDVDAPVAQYWPEFAANGKEGVLVRHILSHTSGVSGWAGLSSIEDIYDWDLATSTLAAQAPWWEPGSASGYHAMNQGHLVGEVVRRIDGRSLGTFFREEIAQPLGADFHIGLPESEMRRVSLNVLPPPMSTAGTTIDPDSPAFKTFTGPPMSAAAALTDEWRRAEIGAANGQGNARSVARIQSLIANGGALHGVQLLTPSTIELVFRQQSANVDLVLGVPLKFGIGYGLPEPQTLPYVPEGRICFWGGWGGSLIVMDLDRNLTISYMMNKMEPGIIGGLRSEAIVRAVYDALG